MKTKKVDNNPIVRQDDLTKVKDSISNYLKGNYPKYLNADAFILHHPNGVEDLKFSSGKIVVINDSERSFQHNI